MLTLVVYFCGRAYVVDNTYKDKMLPAILSQAIATDAHCFDRDDPVLEELAEQHFGGFMPAELTDGFSSLFHDGIEVETGYRVETFQQALVRRCEEYKDLTVALARPTTRKAVRAVALGMFEAGRARSREFTQNYGHHYHKAFNENPYGPSWAFIQGALMAGLPLEEWAKRDFQIKELGAFTCSNDFELYSEAL